MTFLACQIPNEGGDWLNGDHRHGSEYYIFCNVGVPGRAGHDYDNYWEGEKQIWHGKNKSHFSQPAIQNLISGEYRVFIFYREQDRAPFAYAGVGTPIPHFQKHHPVRIDWIFCSDSPSEYSLTNTHSGQAIGKASVLRYS